ncbi:hypothetical protein ACFLX5_04885 [Chloroflexota bacterium]
MLHYHKFKHTFKCQEGDVDINVKASPLERRRLLRLFPYISGSKPSFKVTIDVLSEREIKLSTTLDCYGPRGRTDEHLEPLSSQDGTSIKQIEKKITLLPISTTGDHQVKINLDLKGGKKEHTQDLVAFKAFSNTSVLAWTITIVSVIGFGLWNSISC